MAEDAFGSNAHHTARQIRHYRWVDADFIADAKSCMLEALCDSLNGQFEVKLSKCVHRYDSATAVAPTSVPASALLALASAARVLSSTPCPPCIPPTSSAASAEAVTTTTEPTTAAPSMSILLCGRADYIDSKTGEVWEFKCMHHYSEEHVLQLACYLFLADRTVGKLYTLLSGSIVTVELTDPQKFIAIAMSRYEVKKMGLLSDDIAKWKQAHRIDDNVVVDEKLHQLTRAQ
jgi:hypothetical protein